MVDTRSSQRQFARRVFQTRSGELSSWKSVDEFNNTLDALPHGPDWRCQTVTIESHGRLERVEFWFRDVLGAIRHLISNPQFRHAMRYGPERHYTGEDRGTRAFSEMWTGFWWWRIQVEGATIVPLILSTDTTKLTSFGKKKAYPVYLTIGNISKSVRSRPSQRAWLLVGFIPVPELNWITNQEEKRIAKWELYHTCMSKLMDPVKEAAMRGVEMVCADGGVRRVHPILAAHIADFPEQQTVASTIRTHCPICLVPPNQRGDNDDPAHLRTNHEYKKAYELEDRGYAAMREKLGLRPVRPFWLDLPFANASQFIVPDLLHQMHRGVFGQHVVDWCTKSLGKEEMDRRYTGVPPLSGLRHFDDGISILSMETGAEARAIERTFIPVMAGSQPAEVVGAARCIMDFLYRAHRPQLNENDLVALEMDLSEFHDKAPHASALHLLNPPDGNN